MRDRTIKPTVRIQETVDLMDVLFYLETIKPGAHDAIWGFLGDNIAGNDVLIHLWKIPVEDSKNEFVELLKAEYPNWQNIVWNVSW